MTPSDFDQLVIDTGLAEGCKLVAYPDSVGVWTIGYGTNLQELAIDQCTANNWLRSKLTACDVEAAQAFPWYAGSSPARQRAISELIYNLGLTRLLGFVKFLRAMAADDFQTAHDELLNSRWAVQVGPTRSNRIALAILNG